MAYFFRLSFGSRMRSRTWGAAAGLAVLCLIGGLFVFNSLLRSRQFPYDAMNYTEVARHAAQGEGLVQTTVGMFQPRLRGLPAEGPVPFVAQGPLYPLLMVALNRVGIGIQDAALLLSALGYLTTLLLGHALARQLYGKAASTLALAGLLVYAPLVQAGRTALTESVAAALLLGCLLLLARGTRGHSLRGLFAAGLLAGLAFATRYALIWLIPLGLFWILWQGRERRGARAACFALAAGLSVLPVLLHNRLAGGTLLPTPLASDQGWVQNTHDALLALLGNSLLAERHQSLQAALLVSLLLPLLWQRWRGKGRFPLYNRTGALLFVWAVLYAGILIVQRTRVHFDPLDSRLLLPSGVVLLILGAGLTARTLAPKQGRGVAKALFLLAVMIALGRELRLLRAPLQASAVSRSPRLSWLAEHTTQQDYLLGDDAMDLPFFLQRTRVLSVSAYPYNERVDVALLQERAQRGTPLYIVLRRPRGESEAELVYSYGSLLAALKQGRIPAGVPVVAVATLEDAFIYRVVPDAPAEAPQ